MRVVNGGKDKGTNGVAADVVEVRALLAEIQEMQRQLAIHGAELQQKVATYNLKLTQAAVRRNVTDGFGIDLADGRIKPNAEIQPYKG